MSGLEILAKSGFYKDSGNTVYIQFRAGVVICSITLFKSAVMFNV